MKNFRETTIEAAKAMRITPRELGYEPEIVYRDNPQLISDIRDMIDLMKLDPSECRDYISKEYWSDLGIEEAKYQIVEVKFSKTIYKTVQVVMPATELASHWDDFYDTTYNSIDDVDGETDEDDWEYDSHDYVDSDLSYENASDYDTVNDIDDVEMN